MAVVWARKKRSRQFKADNKAVMNAADEWAVLCSDVNDGADVAAAACPAVGASYSTAYPTLRVVDVDAREGDAVKVGILYAVSVAYSTDPGTNGRDPAEQHPDPTQRPATLRLTFDSFEEGRSKHLDAKPEAEDADGNPIAIASTWAGGTNKWDGVVCNSAGTPFEDGFKGTYRDPCITITKNLATYDFATVWELLAGMADAVNSQPFKIQYRGSTLNVKKNVAWLADMTSEPGYENGVAYETIALTIKVRADGWKRKVLDHGFRAYAGSVDPTKQPEPIPTSEKGDPITQPAMLDGMGHKLADGSRAVFLKFRDKPWADFRRLPLSEIA